MKLANDGGCGNDNAGQEEPERTEPDLEAWVASLPMPVKDRRTCLHEKFATLAAVDRILKEEHDTVPAAFMCSFRVRCIECGMPFEFVGIDAGLLWY